jgi:Uma2 family endonuclease
VTATEDDVVAIHEREKRPYELVDSVLVSKTMGARESYLMIEMGRLLGNFVRPGKLGLVLGADALTRLSPGLIRIPEVSFAADRIPNRQVPRDPVSPLVPNLAIEVLREGNTKKEMSVKLVECFQAGVELVWCVDPKLRRAKVFTSPHPERPARVLGENDVLDGARVLPKFAITLRELFAEPL